MAILHLTDANFQKEVLESDLPVLVDFWANWCGPCKIFAPVIEELAKEFTNKVKFAKLDVDANPGVTNKYSVMSIPTLMLFKRGKIMDHAAGALSKSELKKRIENNL